MTTTTETLTHFYKAFTYLYSFILSNDALMIIKKFYPDVTKEKLDKDLSNRIDDDNTHFEVIKTTDNRFVIIDKGLPYKTLKGLIKYQGSIPYYIPRTLEEMFKYSDFFYYEDCPMLTLLTDLLDSEMSDSFKEVISCSARHDISAQDTLHFLDEKGIKLKDKDGTYEQFVVFYNEYLKRCRKTCLRGHTEKEFDKFYSFIPDYDLQKLALSTNKECPNKEIKKIINELENNLGLPEELKETLTDELKQVIEIRNANEIR